MFLVPRKKGRQRKILMLSYEKIFWIFRQGLRVFEVEKGINKRRT
jgi:hypothetical protein